MLDRLLTKPRLARDPRMQSIILIVFGLTYLGMALGRVPGLKLDRTGIALLGVVVLLATGAVPAGSVGKSVDLPTLMLLFALMIVSAQFAAAGFYDWMAHRLAAAPGSSLRLLALVIAVTGLLSAILANDIIAFAVAPVLADGIRRRGLDPRPFLIGLAGACNAGSAMTVIGNPQNILIGQVGHLDFWRYIAACAPAGLIALAIVFAVVALAWRRVLAATPAVAHETAPALDRWQAAKGVAALLALVILFATPLPRDVGALVIAAALLASRRLSSRDLIGTVDWHLLLLFACLFVATGAFAGLPLASDAMGWLAHHGFLPDRLAVMAPLLAVASNLIGNVPAVMLILSLWHQAPEGAFYGLAVLSTLAGNLLIVGSLANIIVAERAALAGVRLGFGAHARAGIPITILSMAAAVAWLAATGRMAML